VCVCVCVCVCVRVCVYDHLQWMVQYNKDFQFFFQCDFANLGIMKIVNQLSQIRLDGAMALNKMTLTIMTLRIIGLIVTLSIAPMIVRLSLDIYGLLTFTDYQPLPDLLASLAFTNFANFYPRFYCFLTTFTVFSFY
jgi:hypothetical protein